MLRLILQILKNKWKDWNKKKVSVSGWEMLGSKWTFCRQSWWLEAGEWARVRIWASLKSQTDGIQAYEKLQLLWAVSGLQWSGSVKTGPRKEQWWTMWIWHKQGRLQRNQWVYVNCFPETPSWCHLQWPKTMSWQHQVLSCTHCPCKTISRP